MGVSDKSIIPESPNGGRRGRHGPNTAAWVFAAIGGCIWASPPCNGQIETDGYITGSDGISVINTVTNTMVSSIPVGSTGGAVTPDGKSAYVSNRVGRVSVINAATHTVLGSSIDVGGEASEIAITPNANLAYVGTVIPLPADEFSGAISVINTTTNSMLGSPIQIGVPAGIAITPDGRFVYAGANSLFLVGPPTNGKVFVINTTTNTVVNSIPLGTSQSASGLALTPNGKFAYAVTDTSPFLGALAKGAVSVINTTTNMVVGSPIPVGTSAVGIAITPDGKFVYVTNTGDNTVSVINTATNTAVDTIPVGTGPGDVAVTPDGKFIYVLNNGSNTLSIINTATNIVVDSIPAEVGLTFGFFIGPNTIVASGGPLTIANDAALTALGFGQFVDFNGGTLKTTGDLVTSRTVSLLVKGGTIDTNGFNTTLSGNIINSGSLTKIGAGALTLSGNNTYSGGTVLDAGTLVVASPAALGLGDVIVNGGVLTADPGPINVKGNYNQSAAGTLQLGIGGTAPGQYDFLNVTGRAKLGGALQLISLGGFQPKIGDKFTLITAGGGLTGKFANVVDPLSAGPGTFADLVYGANSLSLEFLNFESLAQTPNQLAVAKQLDNLAQDSREAKLISFLANEPIGNLPTDFEKISPDSLTAFYEISFSAANVQAANLENRFTEIRNHSTGFSSSLSVSNAPGTIFRGEDDKRLIEPNKNVLAPSPENRWGVWITGNGDFVNVSGDGNGKGYDFSTGGVTFGLDYRLTRNFALGVAIGYAHTWTDLTGNGQYRCR
jgi:YVTN family beta-propeller protein/autotransporter-associated beta strand protein